VLGGNVSGAVDTITASGSGTITQTSGTVTGTTSVALTSSSGAIGSLNIATPNWTANTTGNVTLVDSQATTGNGVSTGNNISITDSAGGVGALTTSGTITAAGTLALLSTGTNGGVVIGGNVSGTADTITASGSGTITQTSGTVTGTTSVALTSSSGAIGTVALVTPNVTFNTTGDVTLRDTQALTGNGVSTGSNVSFTDSAGGAGALTTSGTITAAGTLALLSTGTNGGVVVGGNVSGTADTITASGSGTITQTGGNITGTTSAAFSSGSGAIGSLTIVTPNWTANTTGNVTLVDSQDTTGNGISTGNNISITDSAGGAGALTTSGTITATGTLALLSTGTNGGVVFGGNVSGTADTITASGSGAITQTGGTVTGTTSTVFTSGSGAIGSLNIVTPNWTANTTGDVTLVDSQATTGNGVSTGANISFTDSAGGGTTISNNITASKTITLLDAGTTTINNSVTVKANSASTSGGLIQFASTTPGGDITVVNNGTVIASNSNSSSIIGFNGGSTGAVTVSGTGTLTADQDNFGNLDSTTLQINPPSSIISPFTGSYTSGNISVVQNSIAGVMQVSGATPPPPPTPPGPTPVTPSSSSGGRSLLISALPTDEIGIEGAGLSRTDTDNTPIYGYVSLTDDERRRSKRAARRNKTSTIPGAKSYNHVFTGKETSLLIHDGMKLYGNNGEDNYLNIDKGNVLLSPDKDIVVGTHEGNINIASGAIAFVMESGNDVVVYDLRQSMAKQVSVMVNNHRVCLHPGNMMVLTRQQVNDFEDIDAECHMISYRGAEEIAVNDKVVKVFIAEYSIASALVTIEPLRQLIASNDRQDKAALEKIIKGAVMLNDFSGNIDLDQLANLDQVATSAEAQH